MLDIIDTAAVGGFSIVLVTQVWLSVGAPIKVVNKWAVVTTAIVYAAVSYTAFGLIYSKVFSLLDHVSDLDDELTSISDLEDSVCATTADVKSRLGSIVSPHTKFVLDMAEPLVHRQDALFGVVSVGIGTIFLFGVGSTFHPPPRVGTAAAARLMMTFTLAVLFTAVTLSFLVDLLLSYHSTVATELEQLRDVPHVCSEAGSLAATFCSDDHPYLKALPHMVSSQWEPQWLVDAGQLCSVETGSVGACSDANLVCCFEQLQVTLCPLAQTLAELDKVDPAELRGLLSFNVYSIAIVGSAAALAIFYADVAVPKEVVDPVYEPVAWGFGIAGVIGTGAAIFLTATGSGPLLVWLFVSALATAAAIYYFRLRKPAKKNDTSIESEKLMVGAL